MLYRIYTEKRDNVAEIVAQHWDAFTILEGTGYWAGERESSLVVEILTPTQTPRGPVHSNVFATARAIKEANAQQAVLITWHDVSSELI